MWPHRRQPTRLPCPWDSLGKNTGVGCHFLLQCMKVKSESEVAPSCQLLATPWTVAYQAPLSVGFSRQEYWSGVPFPPPIYWSTQIYIFLIFYYVRMCVSLKLDTIFYHHQYILTWMQAYLSTDCGQGWSEVSWKSLSHVRLLNCRRILHQLNHKRGGGEQGWSGSKTSSGGIIPMTLIRKNLVQRFEPQVQKHTRASQYRQIQEENR